MKQENPFQPGTPEASKAKDLAKTGKEALQNVKEGAKEIASSTREGLSGQESKEGSGSGAREVGEAARSAAGHIREGAQDVLRDTTTGVKDAGKSIQAIAEDAGETGKKVASDAAEGAKGLGQIAGDVAERASSAVQEVKEEARGILERSKDRVVDSAHRVGPAVRRANRATGSFVSSNVLPISLIGFGAGWALMSGRRQRTRTRPIASAPAESLETQGQQKTPSITSEAKEQLHQTAHGLRDRAAEAGERAAHQAGHLRDVLAERTGKVKQRATHTKERAKAATTRMAEHNPLMLIALSMGAGVSTAMLFPQTKQENRLLGPARDRVIEEAREVASSVGQVAKKAAKDVRSTVSG